MIILYILSGFFFFLAFIGLINTLLHFTMIDLFLTVLFGWIGMKILLIGKKLKARKQHKLHKSKQPPAAPHKRQPSVVELLPKPEEDEQPLPKPASNPVPKPNYTVSIGIVHSQSGSSRQPDPVRDRPQKGSSLFKAISDYVVMDLETTGFDPQHDHIIEVAAIRVRHHETVDQFTSLVKPPIRVTSSITQLTGITNDMLQDAPSIAQVLPDLLSFIGSDVVMGHNVNFDVNFVYDHAEMLGLPAFSNDFLDTLRISRKLYPEERHHRLQDMVDRLHVGDCVAHRAMADVLQTKACYDAMLADMRERGITIRGFRNPDVPRVPKQLPSDPFAGIDALDSMDVYFRGENFRTEGHLDTALALFDLARARGYSSPALFDSYGKVYRKQKDYQKEIDILEEGIACMDANAWNADQLRERRDRALQLLEKEQADQAAALEKARLKEEKKLARQAEKTRAAAEAASVEKMPRGRAVLQLADDMSVIRRYDSIADAVRESGINAKSIRLAANGEQNRAGGYMWRFEDSM